MRFDVSTSSKIPIYRQLIDQIRAGVARGKLSPGVQLPSVRAMSRELVVNPNTIAKAYGVLEQEGVLMTRPGKGVFVAESNATDLTKKARRERLTTSIDGFLTEAVHLGFTSEEVVEMVSHRVGRYQWNG
ncbi:GntR family transcriptional regulator [Planctomycetota bacterium]